MTDPRLSTALAWLAQAHGRHLIGGRWLPGGEPIVTLSPSTGEAIGEVAGAGEAESEQAVAAARAAFEGEWGRALPAERARALLKFADLIDAHAETLAVIEAADGVRPFVEALYGDAPVAARIVRHFAGLIGAIEGDVLYPSIGYVPPGARVRAFVDRRAVGVVSAIVPWNFPLVMAAARIAPALAAGCAVVLKPAEDTSLSALALGKLALEAGLPAGALNVLTGRGEAAGRALVRHGRVDKVSFTGSTRVGREIGAACGAALKKHSLELGGKCPAIVLDDADLDVTAAGLAGAAFANAGQVCVAAARVLAHRSIHDALRERLVAAAGARRPGGTFDVEAGVGPIVNAAQHARVRALLADAAAQGAELSGDPAHGGPGFYLRPTIVSGLPATARMASEETFGPAIALEPFDELDEAIARSNATDYGLAASVWTQRWRDADYAAERLQAGMVYVNCHAFADPAVPMGGLKASGIGIEGGLEGLRGYLQPRTTLAVL